MSCGPSSSVTVSVLSIEGTDCRLDELGRLADRTGGKVRPRRAAREQEASAPYSLNVWTLS